VTVLLDTNVFVWALADQRRLSPVARAAILSTEEPRLLSPLTTYELSQKVRVGKLELPVAPAEFVRLGMESLKLTALPIDFRHTGASDRLAWHHRDPFDRLIALQAIVENVPLVSSDDEFDKYGIQRIW
jgi:PIN domain nuclease of toxin-antitoxin system